MRETDYTLVEIPSNLRRMSIPKPEPALSWPEQLERGALYSGAWVPEVGDRVVVRMNNIGPGTVIGYFREYEWFGVRVKIDTRPKWMQPDQAVDSVVYVFGIEIEALAKEAV